MTLVREALALGKPVMTASLDSVDVGQISAQTPLAFFPEGPEGHTGRPRAVQVRPGHHSDPAWIALCPLPRVCGGQGVHVGRARLEQEQVRRGQKPGGTVMFTPQVQAGWWTRSVGSALCLRCI